MEIAKSYEQASLLYRQNSQIHAMRSCAAYAAYQEIAGKISDKSMLRLLERTAELADFYTADEASVARNAACISKFDGRPVATILERDYECVIRKTLGKRHIRRYKGTAEEKPIEFCAPPGVESEILESHLRYFRENLTEDLLIPSYRSERAVKSEFFSPCDLAATLFYLMTAHDFSFLADDAFLKNADVILDTIQDLWEKKVWLCCKIGLMSRSAESGYSASFDAAILKVALILFQNALAEITPSYGKRLDKMIRGIDLFDFFNAGKMLFSYGKYPGGKLDDGCYTSRWSKGALIYSAEHMSMRYLERKIGSYEDMRILNAFCFERSACRALEKYLSSRSDLTNYGFTNAGRYDTFLHGILLLSLDRQKIAPRCKALSRITIPPRSLGEVVSPPPSVQKFKSCEEEDLFVSACAEEIFSCDSYGNMLLFEEGKRVALPEFCFDGVPFFSDVGCMRYCFKDNGVVFVKNFENRRAVIEYVRGDKFEIKVSSRGISAVSAYFTGSTRGYVFPIGTRRKQDIDGAIKMFGKGYTACKGEYVFASEKFRLQRELRGEPLFTNDCARTTKKILKHIHFLISGEDCAAKEALQAGGYAYVDLHGKEYDSAVTAVDCLRLFGLNIYPVKYDAGEEEDDGREDSAVYGKLYQKEFMQNAALVIDRKLLDREYYDRGFPHSAYPRHNVAHGKSVRHMGEKYTARFTRVDFQPVTRMRRGGNQAYYFSEIGFDGVDILYTDGKSKFSPFYLNADCDGAFSFEYDGTSVRYAVTGREVFLSFDMDFDTGRSSVRIENAGARKQHGYLSVRIRGKVCCAKEIVLSAHGKIEYAEDLFAPETTQEQAEYALEKESILSNAFRLNQNEFVCDNTERARSEGLRRVMITAVMLYRNAERAKELIRSLYECGFGKGIGFLSAVLTAEYVCRYGGGILEEFVSSRGSLRTIAELLLRAVNAPAKSCFLKLLKYCALKAILNIDGLVENRNYCVGAMDRLKRESLGGGIVCDALRCILFRGKKEYAAVLRSLRLSPALRVAAFCTMGDREEFYKEWKKHIASPIGNVSLKDVALSCAMFLSPLYSFGVKLSGDKIAFRDIGENVFRGDVLSVKSRGVVIKCKNTGLDGKMKIGKFTTTPKFISLSGRRRTIPIEI